MLISTAHGLLKVPWLQANDLMLPLAKNVYHCFVYVYCCIYLTGVA